MSNIADYVDCVVAVANFTMAGATLYLAYQAKNQLVFMKRESVLAKYPNVVVFLSGLLAKAKPPVEHHEGYEPLGFVFFNANEKSVVYLGGHLFKWSRDKLLTHETLKALEADFGNPDKGWLGFLNPQLSQPKAMAGAVPKPRTVIVEPSGSITLTSNDENALLKLLSAEVQDNILYTLLVLTLAYPSTPGGIVMIGIPFRVSIYISSNSQDVNVVGEMITEQLIYSSIAKEKNIER